MYGSISDGGVGVRVEAELSDLKYPSQVGGVIDVVIAELPLKSTCALNLPI